MAYTLLNATNNLLKRLRLIQGDAAALTSLTDSARQNFIDNAVKAINDVVRELYTATGLALSNEAAESTITLATATREYDLAANLEQLRWPLIDQTLGQYVLEYPGGYEQMRMDQFQPANWTGTPYWACINPTTGKLRLDRAPTSDLNGRVYNYLYDKRLTLAAPADTFPFSDTVVDAMEMAAAEVYRRFQREAFDAQAYQIGLGEAARLLGRSQPRTRW